MPDTKISALTNGTTANATDAIPIARSGQNYYITPGYILTYARGQANTWTAAQTISGAPFTVSGDISTPAWTTNGVRYKSVPGTLTDTSSSGTVATAYTNVYGGNTIAASNSTTFTNYYTTWINSASTGTNVSFTSRWALGLGGSLDIQAGTVTTNTTPALNLTQTWNAGAVTFTGLKFNATDTASASGSLLMDLQVGGASKLTIDKSGFITAATNANISAGGGGALQVFVSGVSGNRGFLATNNSGLNIVNLSNTWVLGWSSGVATGTADTTLSRAAAATLQLGAADAASPVAQTLQVQSVVAGTSNTAGTNWTLKGSAGTGTGAGGSIIFQVAPAGSSGTAQNAYATALTIDSFKSAFFNGLVAPAVDNGSDLGSSTARWSNLYLATRIYLGSNATVAWNSDTILARDAGNTLALRNGTNAQTFRVYNGADTTNFQRLALSAGVTSNMAVVAADNGGTGLAMGLQFGAALTTGGGVTNIFNINTSGNLVWNTDNAYDIGASGANRPRNVYVATSAVIPTLKADYINNSANNRTFWTFASSADSAQFAQGLTTPLMQFAGTTSSFPALKRSSASLICRLADDSANAAFEALSLKTGAPAGGTSGTWKVGVYNATAPAATGYVEVDIGGTLYKLLAAT